MSDPTTKYCSACGTSMHRTAEACPKCGAQQQDMPLSESGAAIRQASGNKLAAGLCGILLGSFGVHKFILGMTTPGVIMLLVTLLTCGIGAFPMHVIGVIEGIIYLTKSDEDFYQTYVVEKKGWF